MSKLKSQPAPFDASALADRMGLKTDLARKALACALNNICTLDRKQQDYGEGNLVKFGTFGVIVRTSDKLERLANLHKRQLAGAVSDEALADTWLDLSNYGLIGALMQSGRWPSKKTT